MEHQGLSVWETGGFHRKPDLVVVGAGIVGLFTALFHKRAAPQHHVLVLERGAFPSGASVKNAGFACFGSPSELLADIDAEGVDKALLRVEERWQGLQELRAELGDAAIGFEPTGGFEIYRTHDPLYTRVCEEFDALNGHLAGLFGQSPYQWDPSAPDRFGMKGLAPAVHTPLEGPLNTGMLMGTLLRKCVAEGVLIRTSADVRSITDHGSHVELRIGPDETVVAERAVVATNGYTRTLLPQLDVVPARGQVLLTNPIPGLRLKGTFHLDEGFYYFRDHQGAVLLGGGRNLDVPGETTANEGLTAPIQQALETLLRDMILPGTAFSIAHRWSGIMGMGGSKSPIIEHVSERVVAAVRLGGMGVAIGIRVARRAATLSQ